jgi:anti-anti-sigma factor
MDQLTPDSERFSFERSMDSNGDLVLRLDGELDMLSAIGLRETIEKLVADKTEKLTLDLSDLSFMDSSGIAVVVFAANGIDKVELLNPSPIVRRIFGATGLSDFLGTEP